MTGRDEHVRVPAELESQLRGLNSTCEARYVRPETRDAPRRMVACRNLADYVVTLIAAGCGHAISEPLCATHHDVVDSYWEAGRLRVACKSCETAGGAAEMRCELL